ncbi:MAG: sodium:solute symporter family protein, partial [Parvibaculales bacterium]
LTDNALAPAYAVFGLAAIMAFYESVGGMRSVVWTDMLQGILLFIGAMGVIISVLVLFENPFVLAQNLVQNPSPSWPPFTARSWMTGFSTLILFGLVIPLYPHVIQRIYAARNIATLRTSFVLLTFTPFFIILPIIVSAMAAGLILPPLAAGETDQVIPRLIDFLAREQPIMQIFSALFMAAVLAAIMSTMDSAMLSLGAVFNNDFIRPNFPHWSQAKLTRIGRALSWVLMFSMAYAALVFPQDIWSFILLQVDFLAQVFPALAVGVLLPSVRARSVIIGLVTGLLTVLALRYGLVSIDTMGIHAGLIGLVLNLTAVIGAHLLDQKNKFA